MEPNNRRIIEILLGAVFIVILFLIVFLVIEISPPRATITNSYNTYNIYSTASRTQHVSLKPYLVDRIDYAEVYYVPDDFRYAEPENEYLRYYKDGRLQAADGILGNDIDRYEVYVTNREYVGGYFKVIFYFEDYYGKTRSESMTNYVPAREEKLFLFKDIFPREYKYRRWWYEVKSLTKAPTKVYYN